MMEALVISQILLWCVMLAMILVMVAILRQLGVLFERVAPVGALSMNSKLTAGDAAPEARLFSLDGGEVQIGGVPEKARSTLLFFLSMDCPVCKELFPALMSFAKRERQAIDVLFIGSAQEEGHRQMAVERKLPLGNYVISDDLGIAYAVSKLPYAVLIDEVGKIASFGLVNNREHLESLLEAKEAQVASIQEYFKKSA